eukprot:scaffold10232_cov75-Phaeocystis_antarctica.AAC.9
MGLTTCGASMNSSLTPCVLSSVSQPLSSSTLRISKLSPASPCSTRSTISAELEASRGVEKDSAGSAGACCASRKAASCRAVGWSKISVLGSAGAPSPSACCSWLRSSTAPSESSPVSSSGASASTAPPAVRAASASTVSSDTTATAPVLGAGIAVSFTRTAALLLCRCGVSNVGTAPLAPSNFGQSIGRTAASRQCGHSPRDGSRAAPLRSCICPVTRRVADLRNRTPLQPLPDPTGAAPPVRECVEPAVCG